MACRKAVEGLFIKADSNQMRGNGFKQEKARFRLDIRKKFFTVMVVRHWNRLPSDVVNTPSFETLKAMAGTLSNLV